MWGEKAIIKFWCSFTLKLYPSLICEYGYSSRNQPNADLYKELKAKRIEAKHKGDKKTANALKLPLWILIMEL